MNTLLVLLTLLGTPERYPERFPDAQVVVGNTVDLHVNDDLKVSTGGTVADPAYWMVYNSTGTQWELWSTDVDGAGANGVVCSIDDGDDVWDCTDGATFGDTVAILAGGNLTIVGGLIFDTGDQLDLGTACTDGHSQGTGDVCVGGSFQVDGMGYFDDDINLLNGKDLVGGSGSSIQLGSGHSWQTTANKFHLSGTGSKGVTFSLGVDEATAGKGMLEIQGAAAGEMTATSGVQYGTNLTPVVNQSSTAAFIADHISVTDTQSGSGQDYFSRWDWGADADYEFGIKDNGDVETKGKLSFGTASNGGYDCASQTFNYDDLTDGGGAVGTLVMTDTIPDGSDVQKTILHTLTGWTNDTSAIITVGDGTDVDRYNTGTPNVFVTNASGVDVGAVSGTSWHDDAKSITITITTDGDYTAVNAGTATVLVCYYTP